MRAGPSLTATIPFLFVIGIWMTFVLIGKGVSEAYKLLSGIDRPAEGGSVARSVIKYGFGYPLLAGALQVGIMGIHYGISTLLS